MTALLTELARLPAPEPPAKRPSSHALLRKDGDYWTVDDGTVHARLRHAKGITYLDQLLSAPQREFHVLDLVALERGDTAGNRQAAGDAGEVIDRAAQHAYRQRLSELAEELEEAQAFHDCERAARAQAEIDALVEQLTAGLGLGGRSRVGASNAERARVAVTKTLKAAIRRITEVNPRLGHHLTHSVRTGIFCSYSPE
jgi:non-specific serine/threonine protein kinase